jgi:DNA-binding NarL/FixJ family response regulator
MGGEIYLSREISSRLAKKHKTEQPKSPLESLSLRQREILQLVADGQNTKEIGSILKISPKTVDYHRSQLMARLRIFDVPGLVKFALQAGLIAHDTPR